MQAYIVLEVMPDGEIFDAEYYAETYPDVAGALWTDTAVLYRHCHMFGKSEGIMPYAVASQAPPVNAHTAPVRNVQGRFFYNSKIYFLNNNNKSGA